MKLFSQRLVLGLVTTTALLLGGCGGGGGNDQGVSFTATGYFQSVPDTLDELPPFMTGLTVPLSTTAQSAVSFSGAVIAAIGLQNNLSDQFVRARRVYLSYSIAGASVQPPSTISVLSAVLGPFVNPNQAATGNSFAGSLPPSFDIDQNDKAPGNVAIAETDIVPADIMSWLNFNISKLPEPPFRMVVSSRVEGITSAGDSIVTNPVELFISFTAPQSNVIPGGGASSGGSDSDADSGDGA